MIAELGLSLAHTTILRWVQHARAAICANSVNVMSVISGAPSTIMDSTEPAIRPISKPALPAEWADSGSYTERQIVWLSRPSISLSFLRPEFISSSR
jgi:hypothetical protein